MENKTALQKLEGVLHRTQQELAVIQSTVAKGTTPLELAYFLKVADSVGLSPYNKEVWCYKDNKGNLVMFTGRDGLLQIAMKSGEFGGLRSCEVRENDTIEFDIPNGKVNHKFGIKTAERGKIVGAYAIAFRKGCEPTIEFVEFDVYNKGYNAWKTHPSDMIKKCAETRALKKAFGVSCIQPEQEFETEDGIAVPIATEWATPKQIDQIEGLLRTSSMRDMGIEEEIEGQVTMERASELIKQLTDHQLDPIESGSNYSQTAILEKLNKL